MTLKRYLMIMSVLTVISLMSVVSLLYLQRLGPAETSNEASDLLPDLGQVTPFELTDARGDLFHTDAMAGKIWVADFIFTSCPGICPVMTTAMSELHRSYAGNDRVQFVSISVDPDTDTPEVLAKYAAEYEADPERWHFLTGPIEDIHSVSTDIFKVGSLDEPTMHSSRFILVDGSGTIRGYYIGTESAEVARLGVDIAAVLAEDT